MLNECIEGLNINPDGIYVDGTLGGAGHSKEIVKRLSKKGMLIGIDRDEPLDKVLAFAKSTGITYPLGLDPGADIFAKYALRDSGITRNVLIDKEGKIVKLTRLYNEEEFASLVQMINEMLK